MKTILDILPLLLFFIFYKTDGIYTATSTLVFSSIICLGLRWAIYGNIPKSMIVSTVVLCCFGGLTMYFRNPIFIKLKPTIIYSFFSLALVTCAIFNKNALSFITGGALNVESVDWKKMCFYFAFVFAICAVLNECVWRNFPEETWVNFKVIAFPIINIAAIITSYFLFLRKPLGN